LTAEPLSRPRRSCAQFRPLPHRTAGPPDAEPRRPTREDEALG
jgi:hypothetical protein